MADLPKNAPVMAVQQSLTQHSGPLPPAADFERYEIAYPGAAERILAMAEKEADQRHDFNHKALDATVNLDNKGQNYGLAIALSALTATVICAALQQSAPSIVAALVALIGVIPAFLNRRK